MAKKDRKPPHVSKEDADWIVDTGIKAATRFRGDFGELESALGLLFLGKYVGWRVLVLIHNKRTIKKYEEILGIEVRKAFPEEGELSDKSLALNVVKKLNNFWSAVAGETKIEDRRKLT